MSLRAAIQIAFVFAAVNSFAGCISPPGEVPFDEPDAMADPDANGADVSPGLDGSADATNSNSNDMDRDAGPDAGRDAGRDAGGDAGSSRCGVPRPFTLDFPYTRTLWVDDDAATGGDGSENAPFTTLQQAANAATPGTRIVMRAGNYSSTAFITNFDDGTEDAAYSIVGEGGVVISGIDGTPVQLKSPKWVLLDNLAIENVTNGHGLNVDDSGVNGTAHHVALRNIKIANVSPAPSRCIRLTGVNNFVVTGSSFSQCADNAIQVTGGARGTIESSRFFNTVDRGVSLEAGVEDIVVFGNSFENVGDRGVHVGGGGSLREPNAVYAAANIRVIGNIFSNNLSSDSPLADADCLDCLYANNTMLSTPGVILRILRENPASMPGTGGQFVNNLIVVASAPNPFIQVAIGTEPSTYTIDHNAWWVMDDPTFAGPDLSAFIHDGNDVYGDPVLDADGSGRLQSSSPLIGAGAAGVVDNFPDAFGNCFADPPTIGAHEPAVDR